MPCHCRRCLNAGRWPRPVPAGAAGAGAARPLLKGREVAAPGAAGRLSIHRAAGRNWTRAHTQGREAGPVHCATLACGGTLSSRSRSSVGVSSGIQLAMEERARATGTVRGRSVRRTGPSGLQTRHSEAEHARWAPYLHSVPAVAAGKVCVSVRTSKSPWEGPLSTLLARSLFRDIRITLALQLGGGWSSSCTANQLPWRHAARWRRS